MSDAKAAAAARRAKILAGGSSRLSLAKGEAPKPEGPAGAEVDIGAATEAQAASGSIVPEPEVIAAPYRPLAARRNLVKSVASPSPGSEVSNVEGSGESKSAEIDNSANKGDDMSISNPSMVNNDLCLEDTGAADVENKTSSSVPTTPVSNKNEVAESNDADKCETTVKATTASGPAPIISPSIRQVEEEIAKIAVDAAESVEPDTNSKKAVRPLADRRNKIKGGTASSPKPVAQPSATSSQVENEALVKVAMAKAGIVPLQHAVIMRGMRIAAIIIAGAIIGFHSSNSSGPIINSSPLLGDKPDVPTLGELKLKLATTGVFFAEYSSDVNVVMRQLGGFLSKQFENLFSSSSLSSSSAVSSAILTANGLGISFNSSLLETSLFAVLSVWFITGMLSQYISTRFGQVEKEKPKNIVSSIFSFLTTGIEGKIHAYPPVFLLLVPIHSFYPT